MVGVTVRAKGGLHCVSEVMVSTGLGTAILG